MYTLDKSSSYLGDTNRKDELLTVQGSKKKLKDIGRQVCTTATEEEIKKRALGYTILANPLSLDIWLTHLNDRAFNGTEPRIVKLKHPFYVLVRGNDLSADVESDMIINDLMIPYMEGKRDRRCDQQYYMKLREHSAMVVNAPETNDYTPPNTEFGRQYDKNGALMKQIILYFDGEYNNLNSLLKTC